MTFHDENVRKVAALPRGELERIVVQAFDRSDNRRFREEATDADLRDAETELSGIEQARLFDMPTVLDVRIRTVDDDGGITWKHRDEATGKEHEAYHDHMETLHLTSAGIRRRKRDRLADWIAEQGSLFDDEAPIGPYVWREIVCAICGSGYRDGDPFELAHDVAVTLGGGDGSTHWAHRSCNRAS